MGYRQITLRPGPVLKLLNSILTNIQKLQSTHLPRLFITIKYILVIRKMPRSCCLRNTNSIQGILSHAYQVNLNTHLLYNEKNAILLVKSLIRRRFGDVLLYEQLQLFLLKDCTVIYLLKSLISSEKIFHCLTICLAYSRHRILPLSLNYAVH